MEGQVAAAPMAAPAPAAAPSKGISSDKILVTILGGIVAGICFGIGTVIAFKMMRKNLSVKDNKNIEATSAMNGYAPYPPRPPMGMGRPPMGMGGYPPPQYGGYMRYDGKKDFDVNEWLGNNVQD